MTYPGPRGGERMYIPASFCANCGHYSHQHPGFTAMDLDWYTPCTVTGCQCKEYVDGRE